MPITDETPDPPPGAPEKHLATVGRTLWPHQDEAVNAAAAELQTASRALVVAACGTGKTIIGAEISRRIAPAGRVLIVVPTLELLSQTATTYARHLGPAAGRIAAICSYADATADAAGLHEELAEVNVGASTDPARIASWMREAGRVTALTTYQSLPVVLEAHAAHAAPQWDMIVIDEAHRSAGRVDRAWHIVHEEIPAARRLYMTATPRIMDTSGDYDATSMDDPAVFGREVYRLPMSQAIAADLLADYRVLVSVVTDADIHRALDRQGAVLDVDGTPVPAAMLAAQIALLKAAEEFGLRRVITYHRRVALAKRFIATLPAAAKALPGAGAHVDAHWVSGDHAMSERRAVLAHLEHVPDGQMCVVANARVLGEGVDVPELDAVMFTDPKESPTDIVQAIGRALRRGGRDGAKTATIIIPVMAAGAGAEAAALEGSAYDTVWRTIRALRAHDERLADWLDARRVRVTMEDADHSPGRLHDVPSWLHLAGEALPDGFAEAITVRAVEAASSSWWVGYARAKAFFQATGHLEPEKAADPQVFHFVVNCRSAAAAGALTSDRRAALEEIGMVWDPKARSQEEMLDRLAAYRAAFGDVLVPQSYRCADGYPLGSRVNTLRTRPSRLPAAARDALDRLGMVWSLPDRAFAELLEHASAFAALHGGLDVVEHQECCGGYPLGAKLAAKRRLHAAGHLPEQQIRDLDRYGMVWARLRDRRQEAGVRACDRWLEKRRAEGVGDAVLDVPVSHVDAEGYRIGDFIAYWRAVNAGTVRNRDGGVRTVPEDLRQDLEDRGMIWRVAGDRRAATGDEVDAIRELTYAEQTRRIIALIDGGVMASSIADALGIQRPTLHVRVKAARRNPETAGTRTVRGYGGGSD